jgi:hypothetical protein
VIRGLRLKLEEGIEVMEYITRSWSIATLQIQLSLQTYFFHLQQIWRRPTSARGATLEVFYKLIHWLLSIDAAVDTSRKAIFFQATSLDLLKPNSRHARELCVCRRSRMIARPGERACKIISEVKNMVKDSQLRNSLT